MDYRVLGRTGVKISPIGPGSGDFGDGAPPIVAAKIISRALDAGINLKAPASPLPSLGCCGARTSLA